jgi:hypothetical protein
MGTRGVERTGERVERFAFSVGMAASWHMAGIHSHDVGGVLIRELVLD